MSFWKNLFGIKEEKIEEPAPPSVPQLEMPELPILIPLIEGKLYVKLFYHEVETKEGRIKCLSYLTKGLIKVGQRELFLTIKNNHQEYQFYPEPMDLFRQIYMLAGNGRIVNRSDITQFGQKDLLGWKGIVYSDVPQSIHEEIPQDSLALVLLSLDEVQAIQIFGYMRILSMLGNEKRFYPFPYWSDLNRKPLPISQIAEKSVLTKVKGSIKMQHTTVTMRENKIIFSLSLHLDKKFLPQEVLPSSMTVAILPSLDDDTDGCLTWSFDNSVTDAIVPNGSMGTKLGGCFLAIIPEQPNNSSKIFEDGFTLMLTKANWIKFWESLINKTDLLIPVDDDSMDFSLVWV
jgi:hypothetical protein